MVARGAGTARPVLLACCQWGPHALTRRLPSHGAGAWLGVLLLPWRVQCPVRVCAALAANLGGRGQCWVLRLSRSPPPALRSPRCVWRDVPSSCPLPSPAGTPFNAVCAFRGLSPVALLVFPACPLRVCALAASAPFLPPRVGVAHAACVVPVQGTGRALPRGPCPSAFPASAPLAVRLACGAGAARSHSPRACPWVVCPLAGGPVRPRRCGSGGAGGGAACVRPLPGAWPGDPEGRGVALPRYVPLPSLGWHQSRCHRRRSVHGGRGLHTAVVCVRLPTPGVVCGAPLCDGAGPPACRGHCGSRRLAAWERVAYRPSGVPSWLQWLSWGEGGGSPGLSGG